MAVVLGVDFDNTVVSYDEVMSAAAVELGLIGTGRRRTKSKLREHVRRLPDGETHWRRLQGLVYGPRMRQAKLMDGVQSFFESCRRRRVRVDIVSHKTEFASYDETRTNLRAVALAWMKDHRFFEDDGLGLSVSNVHFESTRLQKLERITKLGCTHFVDDLEETFLDESFPSNVEKILFSPHGGCQAMTDVKVVSTWSELAGHLFDAND